jgi:hypothetical protein
MGLIRPDRKSLENLFRRALRSEALRRVLSLGHRLLTKRFSFEGCKAISIVIPTLNEIEGIKKTIKKVPIKELERLGYACEILIVDGGSTDGTTEVARGLGARVIIEPSRGYGRAYKTGFLRSMGDFIVTLDGDGSYPSEHIPKLLRYLTEGGYDFVTTNRFVYMEPKGMSLAHKVGNKVLTLLTRVLFGIDLEDSQSGMWVFKRDVLRYIMPDSDGMSFSEEIKVRAFLNVKAVEIPVPYRKRLGKPKLKGLRDGISNLTYLFVLWLKLCLSGRR